MTKTTPKDFFMNLLHIGLLYTAVVSFITLWFQYINVLFPDLNQYQTGVLDSIRWATSILVVVFPVFIVTGWLLGRDFKAEPEKREVRFRRWLIYFTLFVSAITIIVDLVTLVYQFVSGGLTMAFFLKILAVLIVAVAVFGYYLWDLRRSNFKSAKPKLFAWLAGLVTLASVIYAFFLVGTPAQQRDRRFDEQRVNDLSTIQNEIINFWTRKAQLPARLDELNSDLSGFRVPADPQTAQAYEYQVDSRLSFELCANFSASNAGGTYNKDLSIARPITAIDPYQQNWQHAAGRVCFIRTIDPLLYKPLTGSPLPVKY